MFITDNKDLLLDDLLQRICIELEITNIQRTEAERSYNAVSNWLAIDGTSLSDYNPTIYAQGSLKLDTTVKPKAENEFDLDLVCELDRPVSLEKPIETLDLIEKRLKENETYKNMVERKKRCIRLNYAGQYHMDILPGYPNNKKAKGCLLVPDRKLDDWKDSAPKLYAEWFENSCEYNALLEKKASIEPFPDYDLPQDKVPLKKIVQLMKRYRDMVYSENFEEAPISIVITTLAGHAYSGEWNISDGIEAILHKIKNKLPSNGRLIVLNPVNEDEDFSEKWNQDISLYHSFITWVDNFINEWHTLKNLESIELADKLKEMFGTNITQNAFLKQSNYIEKCRNNNKLAINNKTGMLTGIALSDSFKNEIPVAKNTFYGESLTIKKSSEF